MKFYKANRKVFFKYVVVAFTIFPIVIFLLDQSAFTEKPFLILILLLPVMLLYWIYSDTYYKIEGAQLVYHSAFLHGKIQIEQIKEIAKGKTLWAGIRPALATKGLIIKYNRYDEIYIAPISNEELIADLLKLNSEIRITE